MTSFKQAFLWSLFLISFKLRSCFLSEPHFFEMGLFRKSTWNCWFKRFSLVFQSQKPFSITPMCLEIIFFQLTPKKIISNENLIKIQFLGTDFLSWHWEKYEQNYLKKIENASQNKFFEFLAFRDKNFSTKKKKFVSPDFPSKIKFLEIFF